MFEKLVERRKNSFCLFLIVYCCCQSICLFVFKCMLLHASVHSLPYPQVLILQIWLWLYKTEANAYNVCIIQDGFLSHVMNIYHTNKLILAKQLKEKSVNSLLKARGIHGTQALICSWITWIPMCWKKLVLCMHSKLKTFKDWVSFGRGFGGKFDCMEVENVISLLARISIKKIFN